MTVSCRQYARLLSRYRCWWTNIQRGSDHPPRSQCFDI